MASGAAAGCESQPTIKFLPCGDTALSIQFGEAIERELSLRIIRIAKQLRAARLPGVLEVVPTYRALLLHYDPLVVTSSQLRARVEPLLAASSAPELESPRRWLIPICFDPEFAPDFEYLCQASNSSARELELALTTTEQHVYMLGFAPGQPYMGDLPAQLNIPRRRQPIPRAERGSVLIATGLTIIYPVPNPTGWYVVGRTPIELFDPQRASPALFQAGDQVRFQAITKPEFTRLAAAVAARTFDYSELRPPL